MRLLIKWSGYKFNANVTHFRVVYTVLSNWSDLWDVLVCFHVEFFADVWGYCRVRVFFCSYVWGRVVSACVFLFLLFRFSYTPKHSWWWGCSRAERERILCATQDLGESCLPFSLTWRYKRDRQNILHPLSTLPASARFPRLLVSLRLPEDSCSWGTQGLPEAVAARGCSWSGVGEQRARAGHPPPPPCRHRQLPARPRGEEGHRLWGDTLGIRVHLLCWSSWAYLGDTLHGMFAACSPVAESCRGWSHSGCDLDVQLAFIFLSNLLKWSKSQCLNEVWGLFFNKYAKIRIFI